MSENAEITNVKIVLIGESGVGKTCIVSRFVSDMFDANAPSTNGASYAAKTIYFEEHKVNLQIQLDKKNFVQSQECSIRTQLLLF